MTKTIEKRIERIEDKLDVPDEPPTVIEMVGFWDKSRKPPDRTEGNHTTKFICFEDISKSKQQGKL
jgi:hypothetical protein